MDKFKKQQKQVSYDPTTTVRITPEQKAFIESNSLNLSAIVRDCLERMISETKTEKKGA